MSGSGWWCSKVVVVVVVVRGWIYVSVSGCLGYRTGSVKIYTSGKKVGRVCLVSPYFVWSLGETSKFIGCSLHIQQPAAANLYRECYTLLLNAAAFWLQPAVMNFDVFPYFLLVSSIKSILVWLFPCRLIFKFYLVWFDLPSDIESCPMN